MCNWMSEKCVVSEQVSHYVRSSTSFESRLCLHDAKLHSSNVREHEVDMSQCNIKSDW